MNEYGIPELHVIAKNVPAGDGAAAHVAWSVTMIAPDAAGTRKLGYRASGTIKHDLTDLKFKQHPQVHDADRAVWTTMNLTDRPDIRNKISSLATAGAKELRKTGKDSFEHVIS